MNGYETLRLAHATSGVATLTLARPDKHNALSALAIVELRRAARALESDKEVRAVVLAAQGISFCAGADLTWMRDQFDKDRSERIAAAGELADMLRALDQLSKPLVARVQGPAYGGGIGLLAICDVVIAAETTVFALTEVKLGLTPATIAPYLLARIGEGAARSLGLSGKSFDAEVAQRIGLVSQIVPEASLDQAIETEIGHILRASPGAIAAAKKLYGDLAGNSRPDISEQTAEHLADRWESDEAQSGITRFLALRE